MAEESARKPKLTAARVWRYGSVVLALALGYAGYTIYSRRDENRRLSEQAASQAALAKRAEDQRAIETLGGNRFDILNFYVSPGFIKQGETAQICYGVANAKTVRLDPPAGAVWPSLNRCVDVAPKKSTRYTLTAEDGAGGSKSATVLLDVR
jgi:hypothetical protein